MKTLDEIRKQPGLTIVRTGPDGGHGVVHHQKMSGSVIWSYGAGWEHVSVAPFDRKYTPSWDDMCWLEKMFFRPDEWVVQFHPPEAEYVNNVRNCLHLWRPIDEKLPTPPSILTGFKAITAEQLERMK